MSVGRAAGVLLGVTLAVATIVVSADTPAGGTTVSDAIALTGVAVTPNPRSSDDPPSNAIDGDLSTATWSTESGTITKPEYLEVSFDSTQVNRIRLYKTPDYGPHNLVIQYTTDTGALTGRSWSNVVGLDNGFKGTEAMNITSVDPSTASITGDKHDSTVSGYASLIFDTVTATGLRIAFSGEQPNNHYRVFEFEVRYEAEPPSFTSATTKTFDIGTSGLFNVEATGFPNPIVTLTSGVLPTGLSFSPFNGTGAGGGSISGTPAAGTAGEYPLSFKATNGHDPDATQDVTLTVNEASTTTTRATPRLRVRAPNGGESWARGSVQTVRWGSTNMPRGARLRIELFRGATMVKTLASSRLVSSGAYSWTLGSRLRPGRNYTVRITCNDNGAHDGSDNVFTIT
ncbi:MAG: hypothetical protein QOG90_56 [Actinomycetota bacterium]|jgi:hypothetical protein